MGLSQAGALLHYADEPLHQRLARLALIVAAGFQLPFERADAPGGLLRYGIPEFKMEKRHLDRRLWQMQVAAAQSQS